MGQRTVVNVEWKGNGRFEASDQEGHSAVIEIGKTLSPSQMFLASLAACSLVDVVTILQKRRKKLSNVSARVEGERVDGYPTRYKSIEVTYSIEGEKIIEEEKVLAVELSQTKYCSVSLTVKNGATVNWKLEQKSEKQDRETPDRIAGL